MVTDIPALPHKLIHASAQPWRTGTLSLRLQPSPCPRNPSCLYVSLWLRLSHLATREITRVANVSAELIFEASTQVALFVPLPPRMISLIRSERLTRSHPRMFCDFLLLYWRRVGIRLSLVLCITVLDPSLAHAMIAKGRVLLQQSHVILFGAETRV
jgi:hypothetical protein